MAKREKRPREHTAIQYLAMLVPMLSALPAAYMVGRSTYYYLILGWFEAHVLFWPALGAAVAVVTGIIIEGLGTVSLFLWATFLRWNRVKGTLKGYDKAPAWLAFVCFLGYIIAAIMLLFVLEWKPDVARFAAVLFPLLTAVGGLCWTLYDQHRDRLAYHGLSWNWVVLPIREVNDRDTQVNVQDTMVNAYGEGLNDLGVLRTHVELDETDRIILETYRNNPGATFSAVAQQVEKTLQRQFSRSGAFRRVRDKLEPAGLVVEQGDQWLVHWSDNGGSP